MKLACQTLFLWLALVACDSGSFSRSDDTSTPEAPEGGKGDGNGDVENGNLPEGADTSGDLANPGGVLGGHFDLDTSVTTYPFSKGGTSHHVHEYDDKFNSAGVDFFNMLDDKFIDIKEGIPTVNRPFIIIAANAALSPGATLHINGKAYGVAQWATLASKGQTPTFVLGTPNEGQTQLTSFKVAFDKTKPIEGQLIAAQTKNVVANDPGPGGEYRNGALTIQAIDADNKAIDAKLGVAPIGSTTLFWEATLFWHFP